MRIGEALTLAIQHHQCGQLEKAEQIYQTIATLNPTLAKPLEMLGLIAQQRGRYAVAVDLLQRAANILPSAAALQFELGVALECQHRLPEAIAAYTNAVLLEPNLFEAHLNLGSMCVRIGDFDASIGHLKRAIELNPSVAMSHYNLGVAFAAMGSENEALACYHRSIELKPDYSEAYNNLGVLLRNAGRQNDAIAAYQKAILFRPANVEAWNNLCALYRDSHRLDEAEQAGLSAMQLAPETAIVHHNLGSVYKDQGRLAEAILAYRKAVDLQPESAALHSSLVFALAYDANIDSRALFLECQRWQTQHGEPLAHCIVPHDNDRISERRLRIGYLSSDFRDHCVALYLTPLLACHNHHDFEIFCYSSVDRPDEITRRMQTYADAWRTVGKANDSEVRELIRADKIDILVDLNMHMAGGRPLVLAGKPAPVQVAWLAYPGTTGMNAMDYRFSDPYLDPIGFDESVYSEQTIRLPDSFWCYDPLDGKDLPVSSLPAARNQFVTFGSLNNLCKISDGILSLWAQVLREIKDSRLLLLASGTSKQRMLDRLHREGIDPSRIEFAPRQGRRAYLQIYHRIDIGLDTFPYNGHTTSLDSCVPSMFDSSGCKSRSNLMEVKDSRPQGRHREVRSERRARQRRGLMNKNRI